MKNKTALAGTAETAWDFAPDPPGVSGITLPGFTDGAKDYVQTHDLTKRFSDVVLALTGIFITLPLWGLIAVAVKLSGKGPVFFSQERAGLGGRPFRMLKFRSMVVDAEDRLAEYVNIEELDQPVYKLKNDPRVTGVGRFLRRFGLDELPQLFNVLRGEMSLVGPRPEVVPLVERYTPEQRRRLLVKPGITGYQQIHNRGMPDMAARLVYDLYYLRYRSTTLDLWILMMTIFVIASGEEITY
jgi:lipopolysaccharide/colanic/teichoic acid biosynthesis glycosyltransferase